MGVSEIGLSESKLRTLTFHWLPVLIFWKIGKKPASGAEGEDHEGTGESEEGRGVRSGGLHRSHGPPEGPKPGGQRVSWRQRDSEKKSRGEAEEATSEAALLFCLWCRQDTLGCK